jgi:hypothetical protein
MQRLGESWDVVEVVRSLSQAVGLLTTEVDALQKIVAGQEARLQVLEPRPLLQVGDLVAESEAVAGAVVGASPTAPLTTKPVRAASVTRQR